MLSRVVWQKFTDVTELVTATKTSVNFHRTTRHNITEDNHLNTRRRENLKFQLLNISYLTLWLAYT
jgi:hypothetical protein